MLSYMLLIHVDLILHIHLTELTWYIFVYVCFHLFFGGIKEKFNEICLDMFSQRNIRK